MSRGEPKLTRRAFVGHASVGAGALVIGACSTSSPSRDAGVDRDASFDAGTDAEVGEELDGAADASLDADVRDGSPPDAGWTYEGFGAEATGGEGGDVYTVTNLDADGPGSLRWAFTSKPSPASPRTVEFAVAGWLDHPVSFSDFEAPAYQNMTFAGETAPAGGFGLKRRLYLVQAENMIFRHLRFRHSDIEIPYPYGNAKPLWLTRGATMVFDHCSFSWGLDDSGGFGGIRGLTVSWCTFAEGLATERSNSALHPDAGESSRGVMLTSNAPPDLTSASFHHNLVMSFSKRLPICDWRADVRNNVIYNWAQYATLVKLKQGASGPGRFNIVGNAYKHGPLLADGEHLGIDCREDTETYIAGNTLNGAPEDGHAGRGTLVASPHDFPPVTTTSAAEAEAQVLAGAGAGAGIAQGRDATDVDLVAQYVSNRGLAILPATVAETGHTWDDLAR